MKAYIGIKPGREACVAIALEHEGEETQPLFETRLYRAWIVGDSEGGKEVKTEEVVYGGLLNFGEVRRFFREYGIDMIPADLGTDYVLANRPTALAIRKILEEGDLEPRVATVDI